jgi:hypothetical protein
MGVQGKTHDTRGVSGVGKQKEGDILNRENSIIMTVRHALNNVASFSYKDVKLDDKKRSS